MLLKKYVQCSIVFFVAFMLTVNSGWAQTEKSTLSVKRDNKSGQQNPKTNKKKNVKVSESAKPPTIGAGPKKEPAPISAAREKEILTFVQKHVPQIRPMLTTLKQKKNKGQFNVALRNLDREIRGLKNQEARSPERYPLSLQLWTKRYQVKLVAAKIVTAAKNGSTKSEKQVQRLTAQLKSLINEQFQVRQKQLELDRDNYQSRVDRINKQLDDLAQQKKKEMNRQLDSMKNALNRLKKERNKKPRSNKKKTKSDAIN